MKKEIITSVFNAAFRRPKTRKDREVYDCIVVCGYPAKIDGTPSEIMKTRVDKAIELWKRKNAEYLILSGGAVANQFTEAEVMKKYAMQKGIPESVIYEEKEAVSTYHNMMHVKKLMEQKKLKNCIVVTNGWHIRKANYYAEKFHLDYVMAKAENPGEERFWTTVWRYLSVNLYMYYMMFRGYY